MYTMLHPKFWGNVSEFFASFHREVLLEFRGNSRKRVKHFLQTSDAKHHFCSLGLFGSGFVNLICGVVWGSCAGMILMKLVYLFVMFER